MTIEQLDLFASSAPINKEEEKKSGLTTRQHALKTFLEVNFIPGHFFSIEEICKKFLDKDGEPYYELNTNPYNHDKCIALSNDIRAINWCITERYKLIIKDEKGGCKLAENEKEFDAWRQKEIDKLEPKWKFLNNLKWKQDRDGTVPIVNLNNRALTPEETKPVDVYMRG